MPRSSGRMPGGAEASAAHRAEGYGLDLEAAVAHARVGDGDPGGDGPSSVEDRPVP